MTVLIWRILFIISIVLLKGGNEKNKKITFDIVIDSNVKDQQAPRRRITRDLKPVNPDYSFIISIDLDFSD